VGPGQLHSTRCLVIGHAVPVNDVKGRMLEFARHTCQRVGERLLLVDAVRDWPARLEIDTLGVYFWSSARAEAVESSCE